MSLHHRTIGLPNRVKLEEGVRMLRPTQHALAKAKVRGIALPSVVKVRQRDIVEYCDETAKIVVVRSYSSTHNLALVLVGELLLTVWLNEKTDTHETLDKGRYVRRKT